MTSTDEEERFKRALKTYLKHLRLLSTVFDNGDRDAAFLMSNDLRSIFKNNGKSTSVLAHFKAEDIKILSTVEPVKDVSSLITYQGMLNYKFGSAGGGVSPTLQQSRYKELVSVKEWYHQLVAKDGEHEYTRESIILCVAENDSGTHVDHDLPLGYKHIKKGFFTISDGDGARQLSDTQLIMIRQMAYEFLNSPDVYKLLDK